MAGRFVQATGNVTTTASSSAVVVPVTNLPASGNTLIAFIKTSTSLAVTSVTDPRGNTWTNDVSKANGGPTITILSCFVKTPYQAGDTVSFNHTAVTNCSGNIGEFSGLLTASPAAQTTTASGTSVSPQAAITPTSDKFVIASGVAVSGSSTVAFTQLTGTQIGPGSGMFHSAGWMPVPQGDLSALAPSWLISSLTWAAATVAYKPRPSGLLVAGVS